MPSTVYLYVARVGKPYVPPYFCSFFLSFFKLHHCLIEFICLEVSKKGTKGCFKIMLHRHMSVHTNVEELPGTMILCAYDVDMDVVQEIIDDRQLNNWKPHAHVFMLRYFKNFLWIIFVWISLRSDFFCSVKAAFISYVFFSWLVFVEAVPIVVVLQLLLFILCLIVAVCKCKISAKF